ncbi:peptide ABC transporter substrate-binding protein [Lactobacillus delbrueckii]|jgi:oligopeptide transport system substrate-binding protein|uniref:peptide ABC transporter substrate-binding protein n=1 Tax=Lactobacillus delbrueckii TaxID=1584 RepID=UPI000680342F|nr:peptide ABC transporter substrate-binding protein [Lactobacillus delbrueckii]APG74099.1 peptide ABC transporter substrate-binding protein [Lactobacillus delbrueckii subsp. sunkii]KNE74835.1 peptide ABC transporter substrate-binding protein [Lactobacillus delbrueckii subsp. sunkii]UYX13015.1 peptide ABC transporter substrate-binding protein [Lactobacillus delbrueckii]UYY84830.1 peptide ABC transporter substrate-binding protein [Lactobacillus delbrueckii subsp. indicus]GHN13667.1 oligopeptide
MKLSKILSVGATVLASAALLAACGSNSSKESSSSKKTLNWTVASEIPTMDMSKATDATSFNQLSNTMEGLYRLGKNSKLEKALATSEKVSKDGKTYTYTLRKSKWSDGSELTAKDFVYSWRRTVDPKTASQYSYLFSGIKNADAIVAGKKKPETLGIKAVGKYKLVITLERRIPYFDKLMGFAVFFPQSEKAVTKYGSKYGTASKYMLYNGPFKQVGWTGSNLSWKMVKNPYYWDKKNVKLDTITWSVQKTPSTAYNLYQSNKLDYTGLDASQTKQLKNQKGYVTLNQGATFYLQFNVAKNKYLANTNIRKALSLAVDRKGLTSSLGGNSVPANTLTPTQLTDVNGEDYTKRISKSAKSFYPASTNKKEAVKYMNKGLKELGVSKFSFKILSDDTDAGKKTTEFLQSTFESTFGNKVSVSVQNLPFKTRLSRSTAGNFDIVVSGWSADFADPISFLDLFTSTNPENNGKWKNTSYDKLIADSKTTASTSKRWDDLTKAEDILLNNVGVAPLYYNTNAALIRPTVKDVYQNRGTWNFKDTYIK